MTLEPPLAPLAPPLGAPRAPRAPRGAPRPPRGAPRPPPPPRPPNPRPPVTTQTNQQLSSLSMPQQRAGSIEIGTSSTHIPKQSDRPAGRRDQSIYTPLPPRPPPPRGAPRPPRPGGPPRPLGAPNPIVSESVLIERKEKVKNRVAQPKSFDESLSEKEQEVPKSAFERKRTGMRDYHRREEMMLQEKKSHPLAFCTGSKPCCLSLLRSRFFSVSRRFLKIRSR